MANAIKVLLKDNVARKRAAKDLKEFLYSIMHPKEYQNDLFKRILYEAKDTPFGKENGYGPHLSLHDLKDPDRFKMFTNGDISDKVQRILEGNEEAARYFTNHKILALASSSGTSGKPKLTPVTEKRNETLLKEGPAWFLLNLHDAWKMSKGKTLFYAAIPYKSLEGSVPVINISGYQAINAPEFMVGAQAIPPKVWTTINKKIRDHDIMYHSVLHDDVMHGGCASPLVFYKWWKDITKHRVSLINRMKAEGHATEEYGEGAKYLERAKYLESLGKKFFIDDVHPNMYRMTLIKADSAKSDIDLLKSLFRNPDKIKFVECGVNLSECRATYGIPGEGNPGVPAVNGYVYVFNEFKDGNVSDKRFLVNELKIGKTYSMSSMSWDMPFLWNTDDLFEVTGFYRLFGVLGKVPILNHVGKNNYLNYFQEHVHFKVMESAVNEATDNLKNFNPNFFLKPYTGEDGKKGYNFIFGINDEKRLDLEEMEKIAEKIELFLNENALTYYETRAQHGSSSAVRVQFVKSRAIEGYAAEMAKLNGQYKHKTVHEDMDFGNKLFSEYLVAHVTLSDERVKTIMEEAKRHLKSLIQ